MSDLTTNPNDPRLGHGADNQPVRQNDAYLVLSEEERRKGFVRPVRQVYVHAGPSKPNPAHVLRDLTEEEKKHFTSEGYVKFEEYIPGSHGSATGRYWTLAQLNATGCGAVTRMGYEIAETYARKPEFYGSTYCVGCLMHRPVDEFVWEGTDQRVGS